EENLACVLALEGRLLKERKAAVDKATKGAPDPKLTGEHVGMYFDQVMSPTTMALSAVEDELSQDVNEDGDRPIGSDSAKSLAKLYGACREDVTADIDRLGALASEYALEAENLRSMRAKFAGGK
ncbi:MAG: hypothetical protein ACQKBV_09910, partial [Puniceicoccales bacterium]